MIDAALPWAAGFLDGEGSIQVARAGRGARSHVLRLSATQVARAPIDRLRDMFGGSVYAKPALRPQDRDQWGWEVTSHRAAAALRALLPFLLVKRSEAELALLFQASKTTRRGIAALLVEQAEQESFRLALIEAHHFEEGGDANE